MDANGTHFQLLLGYDDWSKCTDGEGNPLRQLWKNSALEDQNTRLAWDKGYNEITLQPQLFRFTAAPKDKPPLLENRRGAGRDRYGNWYWIAENQEEILVNSAGTGKTTHFWSPGDGVSCAIDAEFGDFQPIEKEQIVTTLQLQGLAVTEDHYLVVGLLNPAGIIIFDLHSGGPPEQKRWPEAIDFVPYDMAAKPGGGVWILDKTNKCYWALDRHFNVIPTNQSMNKPFSDQIDDFQPEDGSSVRGSCGQTFPMGIALCEASPMTVIEPIAIEALPDNTVLILDLNAGQPFSMVYHYDFAKQLGQPVSIAEVQAIVEERIRTDFRLIGHDFAFVTEHEDAEGKVNDRLYIVASDGNQAFAFEITQKENQLALEPIAGYYPMRLFGGKGLIAAANAVYYDFSDRWIPLVQQARPRYITEAILDSPCFDGHSLDCIWHRLMLDACLPPETNIHVWSRAGNDKAEFRYAAWQSEPDPYQRGNGSEIPFARLTSRKYYGTYELLFQQARGRYLQLRLQLTGSGRNTPHIHALRAYYPRFSYEQHYLPAVYREDYQSALFLDRFLANLEGFYTGIEDKIAAVQMLFDIRTAPTDSLEWLASWFGIALDPCWDEDRRRLFIKHIVEFFQYRGTITGLLMALHLVFDQCADESIFIRAAELQTLHANIRIIEKFRTRPILPVVQTDPAAPVEPYLVSTTDRWQPLTGSSELHRRYTQFINPGAETINFPIRKPTETTAATKWQQFARLTLGFIPAATEDDQKSWQDFLARRYHNIGTLNKAWDRSFESFSEVPVFTELPSDFWQLVDWYQFEAIALATQQTAHQFSVMLGVPRSVTVSTDTYQHDLNLAKRIVSLEKPAHTIFDVKFFWTLFRVGVARLGYDTVLDLGGRGPELMPSMILGRGYLAEGFLAPGHPQDVTDRQILGRDHLTI